MPRSCEIARAPAHHATDRADAGRDEAAVGQLADANGDIDMLFEQIDDAVGLHQPDVDVGIGLEEVGDDRQDMQAAEDDRCSDDQVAPRRAVLTGCCALGFSDLFEDALAGRDVRSGPRRSA